MKVIFLDVDGVLNSVDTSEVFQGFVGIDDKLVSKLRKIVRATGAQIVLSSSWKHDWEPLDKDKQNKYGDYLDQKHKKYLLSAVDKTSEANSECRGEGIIEWVGTHEVDSFIILDDEWFDFKMDELIVKFFKRDEEDANERNLEISADR